MLLGLNHNITLISLDLLENKQKPSSASTQSRIVTLSSNFGSVSDIRFDGL